MAESPKLSHLFLHRFLATPHGVDSSVLLASLHRSKYRMLLSLIVFCTQLYTLLKLVASALQNRYTTITTRILEELEDFQVSVVVMILSIVNLT
jgi:hypothetical protein